MCVILLLAIFTALSYCGIPEVRIETKGYTSNFEDGHRTKQSRLTILKETTAESRDYDQIISEPVFKIASGRATGGTLLQSHITRQKRQEKEISRERESDIISVRTKRQVLKKDSDANSTWKDGVFYTFSTSDHVVQRLFRIGAEIWNDATCINFVEDKNARDKVVVVEDPTSFSEVGRRGGDQHLSIGNFEPTVGVAVHEIGHALGLFHTMQRYDRDSFIIILMQNIESNQRSEFDKLNESFANVYGLTYDYGSIMHYDELSYSANGRSTMVPMDHWHQKTMGSELISFSDIFMINEHYGCNARCKKSTSAKCANEGYPHPRNCSTCICPSGYGGVLCDRRPPGCGEDLVAKNRTQNLAYGLGFDSSTRDRSGP